MKIGDILRFTNYIPVHAGFACQVVGKIAAAVFYHAPADLAAEQIVVGADVVSADIVLVIEECN